MTSFTRACRLKIEGVPFQAIEWSKLPESKHPGETGFAVWRTLEQGNVRVRIVEYSPGYLADHWCSRGHVILVLEGRLTTELQDGRSFEMNAGQGYTVADDDTPHRSRSKTGAKLFIVD